MIKSGYNSSEEKKQMIAINKQIILFSSFFLFISILGCPLSTSAGLTDPKSLKLTITATKKVIRRDEPIPIELLFQSQKGTYKLYRCGDELGMEPAVGPDGWIRYLIIGPQGNIIEDYTSGFIAGTKKPFKGDNIKVTPIKPHKEIMDIFPYHKYKPRRSWPAYGEYNIMMIYSLKTCSSCRYFDLWLGRVRSNWITFTVRPPTIEENENKKKVFVVDRLPGIDENVPSHILNDNTKPYLYVVEHAGIWYAYNIKFNNTLFRIAVSKESPRIIYIETNDEKFTTPCGFSLNSTAFEISKTQSQDFDFNDFPASYLTLPSGWNAMLYDRNSSSTQKLPKDSKPLFFFKEKGLYEVR